MPSWANPPRRNQADLLDFRSAPFRYQFYIIPDMHDIIRN
jgi:hypothetical protein